MNWWSVGIGVLVIVAIVILGVGYLIGDVREHENWDE